MENKNGGRTPSRRAGKQYTAQQQRKKILEQLVLNELRFYKQTRNELKMIRRMKVKPVSTPTLLHLEKTVYAVETALKRTRNLPEGEARVKMLRMRYWGYGKTSINIIMDVHVAKSTYYKWHKDFVKMVGELMGMEL